MPKQKDLKRLVRTRMQKTGESYTAARHQLLAKKETPKPDYAARAAISDASVRSATGRGWGEWVALLDDAGAASKPHRDIARHVAGLGVASWWSQMVTVGYERIRGLRERGQRRDGSYEAGKSRTFAVPAARLYHAFADARTRKRWLAVAVTVASSTPEKRVRLAWSDGTRVEIVFTPKGEARSSVAITHCGLADRAAIDAAKAMWQEHLDRLAALLA